MKPKGRSAVWKMFRRAIVVPGAVLLAGGCTADAARQGASERGPFGPAAAPE